MSIMAKYSRIFWAEPTDADVGARNRSVAALSGAFGLLTQLQAIDLASSLVRSLGGDDFPADLSATVEKAISNESEAFQLKGKELQGAVCALVAAMDLVSSAPHDKDGWTAADALAAALWSGLAARDPHEAALVEDLRCDVLKACHDRVKEVAKHMRKRRNVPDVGTLTIPEDAPTGSRANTAYRRATAPVIEALTANADLDREEIDFLWWVLADHSDLLRCPLAEKGMLCRGVAVGIEGASFLRSLPSDGHKYVALRLIGKSDEVTIEGLAAAIGEDRAKLGKKYTGSWAAERPAVFPLLSALASDAAVSGSSVKLDARGWGARALLEAAIVRLQDRVTESQK